MNRVLVNIQLYTLKCSFDRLRLEIIIIRLVFLNGWASWTGLGLWTHKNQTQPNLYHIRKLGGHLLEPPTRARI